MKKLVLPLLTLSKPLSALSFFIALITFSASSNNLWYLFGYFSSVVFDIMYRKKPFIIYFPDLDEPNIDIIYSKSYRNVIKKMKNNKFGFKNVCFNINETIQKS